MKTPTATDKVKVPSRSTGASEAKEAKSRPSYKEKMQAALASRRARPKMKK